MWKESYRIGIESIDEQHKALFDAVGKLLQAIEKNDETSRDVYAGTLSFLQSYVARHFRDEEAYQSSIGYAGLEAHRKYHQEFTRDIAEHARKIEESDYDIKIVKELSGILMTWLVYHVTYMDQRIAVNAVEQAHGTSKTSGSAFQESTLTVLQAMLSLDEKKIRKTSNPVPAFEGDVFVEMMLTGSITGYVTFIYSKEFAYELLRAMAGFEPVTLDEIVRSVVGEISNIITKKAIAKLPAGEYNIAAPSVFAERYSVKEREGFHFVTEKGEIQVLLSII